MMNTPIQCAGHGDYTHDELQASFGRCGGCGQSRAPFDPVVNDQLVQLDAMISQLANVQRTLKLYGAAWYAAGRTHRELVECRRHVANGD